MAMESYRPEVENGEWRMDSGEWRVEEARWRLKQVVENKTNEVSVYKTQ